MQLSWVGTGGKQTSPYLHRYVIGTNCIPILHPLHFLLTNRCLIHPLSCLLLSPLCLSHFFLLTFSFGYFPVLPHSTTRPRCLLLSVQCKQLTPSQQFLSALQLYLHSHLPAVFYHVSTHSWTLCNIRPSSTFAFTFTPLLFLISRVILQSTIQLCWATFSPVSHLYQIAPSAKDVHLPPFLYVALCYSVFFNYLFTAAISILLGKSLSCALPHSLLNTTSTQHLLITSVPFTYWCQLQPPLCGPWAHSITSPTYSRIPLLSNIHFKSWITSFKDDNKDSWRFYSTIVFKANFMFDNEKSKTE